MSAVGAQLVERAPHRAQRPRRRQLAHLDLRGNAGLGLHDEHVLRVLFLAEVDLDRRAGVPRGRGRGHALRAVQVPERDVVRVPREVERLDAVVEDRLRVALAATERAAAHEAVRGDDVDRVRAEAFRERGDEQPHALGVQAGRLRCVELEHLLGPDREPLRHERQQDERRGLALRLDRDDATALGAGGVAEQRDAGRAEHRRERVE